MKCAARLSSMTFQRWTTCVTALCLTWVAIGLVQWLSRTPRPLEVVQVLSSLILIYYYWLSPFTILVFNFLSDLHSRNDPSFTMCRLC